MALSCYSSNRTFLEPEPELQMELLGFQNDLFLDQNPSMHPIFDNHHTLPQPFQQASPQLGTNIKTQQHSTNRHGDFSVMCPTLIAEFLPPLKCCQNFDCSFLASQQSKTSIETHEHNNNGYNHTNCDDLSVMFPTQTPEFLPPLKRYQNFDSSFPVSQQLETNIKTYEHNGDRYNHTESDDLCDLRSALIPEFLPPLKWNQDFDCSFPDCQQLETNIKTLEHNNTNYNHTNFDDMSVMCPALVPEFLPPLKCLQDFDCPFAVFSVGWKEDNGGGTVVSVQSRAARQRRRKITDKTRELGKLIPGAHKMNTAEMFQAAYKYIQFMRAQVGVLQHISTVQEKEDDLHTRRLKQLVSSSHRQQKLYSSEKCLFPKQLLHRLQGLDHPDIISDSTSAQELQNLISNSG